MRFPLATLVLLGWAAAALAQDNTHALHFDPPALTLEVGERGRFTVRMSRQGVEVPTAPRDYKVAVRPGPGAQLRTDGAAFVFAADRPGAYEVAVEHDSGRAWFGARGSIWVRVVEARPLVRAIAAWRAVDRAAVGGAVALPLVVGEAVLVEAAALDAGNRPVPGVEVVWSASSRALRIHPTGAGRVELTALAAPGPGERFAVVVGVTGGPQLEIPCVVQAPAPAVLAIALLRDDTREAIDPAAPLALEPGDRIVLRAVHQDERAQPVRGATFGWALDPPGLGRIDQGHWGTVTLTVFERAPRGPARLFVTVAGTALRREQPLHIGRAHRGAARIALLHGERGEAVPEVLVLAPGARVPLRALGYDASGAEMPRFTARWELDAAGGVIDVDQTGAALLVAGTTPGRYTASARCAASGHRAAFAVEIRPASAPAPAPDRMALFAQVGGGWMAVDPSQPLWLARGTPLVLRLVGQVAGREVLVPARFDGAGGSVTPLDAATARIAVAPGRGALVVVSAQGVPLPPVHLVVVVP